MTNVERMNEQKILTQFMIDYSRVNDGAGFRAFYDKYRIRRGVPIATWLMEEEGYRDKAIVGMRVKKTYTRRDGEPFVLSGTVTQVINDNKGEHILVQWDEVESFKTMEVLGEDSVEIEG